MTTSPAVAFAPSGERGAARAIELLAPWIFGLAPALLFLITWGDRYSGWQNLSRGYALPVVAIEFLIIAASFSLGWRLGRPNRLAVVLIAALGVILWVSALAAPHPFSSVLRTYIWTIHLTFAFAVVNLWHHRALDVDRFQTALLTGFVLTFAMLVVYVATTGQSAWDVGRNLPGFGHVRRVCYYAAGVVGLCAPGFLRGSRFSLFTASLAFTMAFWSGGRAVLVMPIVALAVCTVLFRDFRSLRCWLLVALTVLVGLIVATGLDALVPLGELGPDRMAHADNTIRLLVWRDTVEHILMRPWFGWGEGQFRFVLGYKWSHVHPHNVVLQVLFAWGVIGGLLFLILAIWLARKFLKAPPQAAPFQWAALAIAAYAMVDGALYQVHSASLFAFCCAAVVALGQPRNEPGEADA